MYYKNELSKVTEVGHGKELDNLGRGWCTEWLILKILYNFQFASKLDEENQNGTVIVSNSQTKRR